MPRYEVAFERTQVFIERIEIEADSEQHAEEIANGMLDNEDVAFDVESNCSDEVLEILEVFDDEEEEDGE